MKTTEFKTFTVEVKDAQAWVTIDYPPVNIQGTAMLDDLNNLAEQFTCWLMDTSR